MTYSSDQLRVGVVGVGRMGRHHARVYAQSDSCELVGVVDDNVENRETNAETHACAACESVEQLLELGVQAVSIAVPTTAHLRYAQKLLPAGVACLIEKPLAPDVDEATKLVELAESSGTILQVGHIERYNPAVRALRRQQAVDGMEITPRFIEVHRVSPMTFRSVDVSVVFDMMIHDLDVVLMLMGGSEPVDVQAAGVPVITDHDDVCNARLTFERPQGLCVANITASRLAFKTERKTRIIADDAYVSIDYAKRAGVLIRKTADETRWHTVQDALRDGKDLSDVDYGDLVRIEDLPVDDADQLELQIGEFLESVRTGNQPDVDARAGFAAVRTAERIEAASRAARSVTSPA
ncbi:MAG: Gfo/Idh/MocA family protein [Planctomycetota bacterium]|jgi:predicted dehydrogenase